jgi:hypothetical protein
MGRKTVNLVGAEHMVPFHETDRFFAGFTGLPIGVGLVRGRIEDAERAAFALAHLAAEFG